MKSSLLLWAVAGLSLIVSCGDSPHSPSNVELATPGVESMTLPLFVDVDTTSIAVGQNYLKAARDLSNWVDGVRTDSLGSTVAQFEAIINTTPAMSPDSSAWQWSIATTAYMSLLSREVKFDSLVWTLTVNDSIRCKGKSDTTLQSGNWSFYNALSGAASYRVVYNFSIVDSLYFECKRIADDSYFQYAQGKTKKSITVSDAASQKNRLVTMNVQTGAGSYGEVDWWTGAFVQRCWGPKTAGYPDLDLASCQ